MRKLEAQDGGTVMSALADAVRLDRLGYLEGLARISFAPDEDVWHSYYEDDRDEIVVEAKFADADPQSQVEQFLHEAGHRGQLKVDKPAFAAFKAAGLVTPENFEAMANRVHFDDYQRNKRVEGGMAGECFAESYARHCLGLAMPGPIAEFWRERERRELARDAKITKAAAGYIDGWTNTATMCRRCVMFRPPDDCTLVIKGDGIRPRAHCKRFAAKGSEDAWNEGDHPRGQPENAGEFAPKGSGGAAGHTAQAPAAKPIPAAKTAPAASAGAAEPPPKPSIQERLKKALSKDKVKADLEKIGAAGNYIGNRDAALNTLADELVGHDIDADEFKAGMAAETSPVHKIGKLRFGTTTGGQVIVNLQPTTAGGDMTRIFDFPKKRVIHSYFSLPGGSQQQGIGKAFLKSQVGIYRKLGIEDVEVHANIDVGGYSWARYGFVPTMAQWRGLRERLDERINGQGGGEAVLADDWDELPSSAQERAEQEYQEQNLDSELEYQREQWRENDAMEDARNVTASDFDPEESGWARDAIDEVLNAREAAGKPNQFTADDLLGAMTVEYSYGDQEPEIEFTPAVLKKSLGGKQKSLPGIEAETVEEKLASMNTDLQSALLRHFEKAAKKRVDDGDIDPPDYLDENARESIAESWVSMSARDRLNWTRRNTNVLEEYAEERPREDAVDIPEPARAALSKLAASDDPKAIWAIADSPYGKQLLLGEDWHGTLNLADPATNARFDSYVKDA